MSFKKTLQTRAKKNQASNVVDKFSVYDVLIWPLMTEKTHKMQESDNKYSFRVHGKANKNDVKLAIKYLYNVDALKVRIVNVKYKKRQQRGLVRRAFKKAIVTLRKKDKIELGT